MGINDTILIDYQNPYQSEINYDLYMCDCKQLIHSNYRYCPKCGKQIRWLNRKSY